MNAQELKLKLEAILGIDQIGVNVFFILKNSEDTFNIKKADIRQDAMDSLITSLTYNIHEIVDQISSNEDFRVLNLSSADDRTSAIYEYDLDERPDTFYFIDEVANHIEAGYFSIENGNVFLFNNDRLEDIDGYIIKLGDTDNNILLYRKNYPVNVFKQNKIYLIKGDDSQFTTMNDSFLRVDAKIDFFRLDDSVFIYNLSVLEKFSDFHQIISAEASKSIEQIDALGLVENIEILSERINELSFARKLTKISTISPVFTLPKVQVLSFAQAHRMLSTAFKYSEDGNIILDTKKSQNLFIRLLNDDFLHSQLSNTDYLTPAKDKLD